MLCYFCEQKLSQYLDSLVSKIVCEQCQNQLDSQWLSLPDLPNIEYGAYFYTYNEQVRRMIREIKFCGNWVMAQLFNNHIHQVPIPSIFFESDCIVTVPTHWIRQFWRGKPHIPLMFHSIIQRNDCFYPSYLKRTRYSRSSYELTRQGREMAMAQSRFLWKGPNHVRSVTIIDDICTTGSTVIEIARLLKSHGVATVRVLVAAYVDEFNKNC